MSDRGISEGKKELILKTTLDLVSELGLKGTTIAQISKHAKLSPGIIYYYFNSKDEILHTLYSNLESAFVDSVNIDAPLTKPIFECYQ